MSSPERQELIRNAVTFLSDPQAQASPLAQRIQFLEAKGLTTSEVQEALKQASSNTTSQPYQTPYASVYGPSPYPRVAPPQWDWRDYFIAFVVSGGIAYGAVSLLRKYLLPHLQPPTSTAYEQDLDALTAQFDAAEAMLKEIQAETASVRTAVEEQNAKVDKATHDVEVAVKEIREGEAKTRNEMTEIREEVNNIREMLPKMIEKSKDSQSLSLVELQQELKSLKALLLNRGPGLSNSPSSTPLVSSGRPSIPAWQLANPTQDAMSSSNSVYPTSPDPTTNDSSGVTNGKKKHIEVT